MDKTGRSIVLDTDTFDQLTRHARPRGCTVHELARRLFAVLLTDQLIDAVLDDADERRSPPCPHRRTI